MHGCDYILCLPGHSSTKRHPFVSVKFVETSRQTGAAERRTRRERSRRSGVSHQSTRKIAEEGVPYLAQGTLQLGFSSEENFFSRKAHISSAVSISERAASTGQTFEGPFEDFTSSMSSSA